ncbi:MAG: hypothetical protein JWL64_2014 [Frankiales bacterium]|nr:hypothetical protein [Frankiales bacterium]
MASLFSKVSKFANSKAGRDALDKAKRAANDPKNKEKLNDLVDKVKSHKPGSKDSAVPTTPPQTPPGSAPATPPPGAPTPPDAGFGGPATPPTPPSQV